MSRSENRRTALTPEVTAAPCNQLAHQIWNSPVGREFSNHAAAQCVPAAAVIPEQRNLS